MKRPRIFTTFVILLSLVLQMMPGIPIASAQNTEEDEAPAFVPGQLIIKFQTGVTAEQIADFYQEFGLVQKDDLDSNPEDDNPEQKLAASPEDITSELIDELERDARVIYAEPNYLLQINQAPNDPQYNKLWGLHNTGQTGGSPDADVDAPEAWEISTGSEDIIVAVIDTGLDHTHEDLLDNLWVNTKECPGGVGKCEADGEDDDNNGYVDDFHGVNTINGSGDPMDDFGHGTHVAGTIGAVGGNSKGVVGVNWKIQIAGCKFLSASGGGTTANAIKCFQYFDELKNKQGYNVLITNNSWGGGAASQALKDAMSGQDQPLHVCAAGNANSSGPHYPSSYDLENIISVAATDHADTYASFSNYGTPHVDLAAPGVAIVSTVPKGGCPLCDSSGYRAVNGTSMASPHVAGAAALIWSEFPDLTPTQVKSRIMTGVDSLEDLSKQTVTNGRLNVLNTLEDDTTPPAAVSNLSLAGSLLTGVNLAWTATGDDGLTGTANIYDVRYSTSPISEANWEDATQAVGEPKPQAAGTTETFALAGLTPGQTYYFALKVLDNVGNASDLSNVIAGGTSKGTVIFEDDMESGPGEWVAKGSDDLWHLSEHRSNSPNTAWYYGIEDEWNYNTGGANAGTLTSPAIELAGADDALLTFYEWSEVESSKNFDRTRVQVSTDGQQFETIFESHGTEDKWAKRQVSLTPYIAETGTVYIRFYFDTIDHRFNNFEGWYIDDVQIFVATAEPPGETAPTPNLVMHEANIGLNPPHPTQGDSVVVNATVLNKGMAEASNVRIQFVDATDDGAVPIGQQTITNIPVGGSGDAQILYQTEGKLGDRQIRIIVDPNNFIQESNESDNQATRTVTVAEPLAPNLAIATSNVGFDPPSPSPGDQVTINATVINNGTAEASDIVVQFFDVSGTGSIPIGQQQSIDVMAVGGSSTVQVTYDTTGTEGDRDIKVVVDPNNAVAESDEEDNEVETKLKMAPQPAPNLVVQSSNIGFDSASPTAGDTVTINATILNNGAIEATDVLVQFVDVTGGGSVPIGQQQTIDVIPAGGSGSAQVTYNTSGKPGDRKIEIVADPHNFVPESKETDNSAKGTLTVGALPAPNLVVKSSNIGFGPPRPTRGDEVTINVTVINDGTSEANDVQVQVVDVTNGASIPIDIKQTIASIPAGGSGTIQVAYDTSRVVGERKIQVVVDPNNFISESNETDNSASETLLVSASASPNLVMLADNVEFTPPTPTDGDSVTIYAVVLNNGSADASDILVQFVDVTGGNSVPIGAEQTIADIPVGGSGTAWATYDTNGKAGDRKIQILVDSNNLIDESNEKDNEAARTLSVAALPISNLTVQADDIGFNPPHPSVGEPVTVSVAIFNDGTADASDIVLQFVDVTGGGALPIGQPQTIDNIPVGGSGTVEVVYDTEGKVGDRHIRVVIDPNNFIQESKETDNKATETLVVMPPPAPNLMVHARNIGFNPPNPVEGEQVSVTVAILNNGTMDAEDVLIQFVDVTGGGLVPIDAKQTIGVIPAGGSSTAQVIYETAGKPGSRKIQVLVDPHTTIPEFNEKDNNATETLRIAPAPAPNLVVQSTNIGFSVAGPTVGDSVVLNVTVLNDGSAPASDVVVQFVDVTGGGSSPIGTNQTIETIPVGGSGSAQVTYDTTGKVGDRNIEVVADRNNLIPETKENDNSAKKTLTVGALPEPNLVVQAGNIGFAPPHADPGAQVTINATILNVGTAEANDIVVQFVDVSNGSGSVPIGQQQVIDAIPSGGSGIAQVTYDTTGRTSDRKIEVLVDPNNFIPEAKETDNKAQKTLKIVQPPTPNLVIKASNIGFNPLHPEQGDRVTINAAVLNDGTAEATDIMVQFIDVTNSDVPMPISQPQTIDAISIGSSGTASVLYETGGMSGDRKIEVRVDPNNFIPEAKETDNSAKVTMFVGESPAANLVVLEENIGFNPPDPTESDFVLVNVVVLNNGLADANDVVVQFVDVTNGASTPIGQPSTIATLPVGASGAVQVTYDTSGKVGDRKIQIIADPNNFIPESDEDDNEAAATLSVAPPPTPNLVMVSGNIKFEPAKPNQGDSVDVSVTVINEGTADASDVVVQILDITNGGAQPVGTEQIIDLIPAGGNGTVQVTFEDTDEPGERQIQVSVDPSDTVAESNESDNQTTKPLTITPPPAPNLVVKESNIKTSPDKPSEGLPVTIKVTVQNTGNEDASGVSVLFVDVTNGSPTPIGQAQTIATIPAGGSGEAQISYDTTGKQGDRTVQVIADPDDFIAEPNEDDNAATTSFKVGPPSEDPVTDPNLVVRASNIKFDPAKPTEGDPVTVTMIILNDGTVGVDAVTIQVDDITDGGEEAIETITVDDGIAAKESVTISITYDTTGKAGNRKIRVTADPDDEIKEVKETDNQAAKTLTVAAPSSDEPSNQPNLAVYPSDIALGTDGTGEDARLVLAAAVHNLGDIEAEKVVVQFVDITDGESLPIGEPQAINAIGVGDSVTAKVLYEATELIGDREIQVVVDPENEILESNEADNQASKLLSLESQAVLDRPAPPPAPVQVSVVESR